MRLTMTGQRVQQPDWEDQGLLGEMVSELAGRPPLVDAASCLALRDQLRAAAVGQAFLLQAGDCAERFADCVPDRVHDKTCQLHGLADHLQDATGRPVIRVGRLAGQFAKPRSCATEVLPDGSVVPTYRGDAVNDVMPTPQARKPDPRRLLQAYDCAARAIDALTVNGWLVPSGTPAPDARVATYISHEALLLDYEQALVRERPGVADSVYASSAHLLWIGDRTRQADGAHMRFAAMVDNPVAVKVGPSASPGEVRELVARLTDGHPLGRLVLISRMGAGRVADRLRPVLGALDDLAARVVWSCDPMHGNTITNRHHQKVRVVDDMLREVDGFVSVLDEHDLRPGGLHLETAPDPVTECLDTARDLSRDRMLPRYESACDPRLSPPQADRVITHTAQLLGATR